MNNNTFYTPPEIAYEGELEIQAGSPLSVSPGLEDWELWE